MKAVYGSRLLNDNGNVLGLNAADLVSGVAVLIVSAEILKPLGIEVFSVPLACLSIVMLIPVRLRYRRKIIRDTIRAYLFPRGFKNGISRVRRIS